FELIEVLERVEDAGLAAAPPRGRTHAVEDQRVRRSAGAGLVAMLQRVEPHVGNGAALELVEQRAEPVRVLVINGHRTIRMDGHVALPFVGSEMESKTPTAPLAGSRGLGSELVRVLATHRHPCAGAACSLGACNTRTYTWCSGDESRRNPFVQREKPTNSPRI